MTNFNRFMIGLLASLLLLIACSFVLRQMLKAQIDEIHTLQNEAATFERLSHDLQLSIERARSAVRGYLFTSNATVLSPFHYTQKSVPNLIRLIDENAESSSKQLGSRLLEKWAELELHLAAKVEFIRLGNKEAALNLVNNGLSDKLFADLDLDVAFRKEQYENASMAAIAKEERIRLLQDTLMGAFFILSFGLVLVLGVQYRKNIGRPLDQMTNKLKMQPSNLRQALEKVEVTEPQLANLRQAIIDHSDEVIALKNQRVAQEIEKARSQEEFSAVLAHELRTPLTTLMGLIDLTTVDTAYTSDQALQDSRAVATSLLDLINSTLDYQRIKLGHYEAKANKFSPAGLGQDVLDACVGPHVDRVAELFTSIDTDCLIEADQPKVRQVLINLVSNAVKFSDAGSSIKLRMYLHGQENSRQLVCEVEDNGDGVSVEDQSRIFEAFTQGSSGTRRRHDGTGLGLTLSKAIAHALGGDLTLKSRLGVGSTFTFTIPVSVAQKPEVIQVAPEAPTVDFSHKRFLMVEDHVLNCEVYQHILESSLGVKVDAVHTAEEALALFENGERFDMVLMDINLGAGMDGLEATKQLKTRYAKECPPVIAISAGLNDLNSAEVKNSGIDSALGKPFEIQTFVREASRCMGLRLAA